MFEVKKLLAILFLIQPLVLFATEITLDSVPPVVVSTTPKAGIANVEVSLNKISVTFSKDMMTKEMWSVLMVDGGLFPKITGSVKYLGDKRTFVMPVKLLPNKTYAMRFNSKDNNAFRDTTGKPAESYLLVFKTK